MQLDLDERGIPTEPFGFSNNPEVSYGAPKFEAFAFEFTKDNMRAEINLQEINI